MGMVMSVNKVASVRTSPTRKGLIYIASILAGLSTAPLCATAQIRLTCASDEDSYAIKLPSGQEITGALRGFVLFQNSSPDWYSCHATCRFQDSVSNATALAFSCDGVAPPSHGKTPGALADQSILCLLSVVNAFGPIAPTSNLAMGSCRKIVPNPNPAVR